MSDVVRAIRKKFPVRNIPKNQFFWNTISSSRTRLANLSNEETLAYLVFTFEEDWNIDSGHLVLLNKEGATVIDTCETYGYDSRRIIVISEVKKIK
jgi:hypothetical protein